MAAPEHGQRLLTTLAVAIAMAAGALGLGRVFIGAEPRLQLLAFAVGSALIAGLLLRRSVVISAVVSVLAATTALGIVLVPESTWHGVPTWHTLRVLGGLLGLAGAEMRLQVAPTMPLGGLLLAAFAAVWIVGWISHCLAARTRAPLAAAVGPLVLFTFGDVLVDEGSRPGYSVFLLLGIMALLFADGLARVRRWGPLEIWRGPSRRTGSLTLRATRGAWGIALGAILVATLAPGMLPGWESPSVLHPIAGPGGGKDVDPLVSIQSELNLDRPQRLFAVTASRPAYWRILALTTFNGTTWSAPDLTASSGEQLSGRAPLLTEGGGTSVLNEQRFEILALESPWLPMAADPLAISLEEVSIRFDPNLVMAVAEGGLRRGDGYSVVSRILEPDPADLDAAPDLVTAEGQALLPPGFYENNVGIGSVSPIVRQTAVRWTSGVQADDQPVSEYRKMLAIQQHLRDGFVYDATVSPPAGIDPLEWFLNDSRRGFCQQFAGAMTAMARSLGYPARVAVGFLPGTDMGDGTYEVTTADAHAWPEVYFAGVGWVAFEPTPGRTNPVATTYLDPAYLSQARPSGGVKGGPAGVAVHRLTGLRWKARHATDAGFGEIPVPAEPFPWARTILLVLAAITVAGMLLVPPYKALARWWRLHRAPDPRASVLAAYDVLESRLDDIGVRRAGGQTLREFGGELGERGAEVGVLVDLTTRAAYGHEDITDPQARDAVTAARAAGRQLVRQAPLQRRFGGLFRVPSRSGARNP